MDDLFLNSFGGENPDVAIARHGGAPASSLSYALNLFIEIHFEMPVLDSLLLIQGPVIQIRCLLIDLLARRSFILVSHFLVLVVVLLVFVQVLELALAGNDETRVVKARHTAIEVIIQ